MKFAQIADIHVRLYKRYDEYEQVFKKLYDSLRKNHVDIIFVLGDIFHSKNVLSPESVRMATNFFTELANIATVYILVGNHDANLKNLDRLDSLTPNIEKIKDTNFPIYLLKKSEMFGIGNEINVGVFSPLDHEHFPYLTEEQKNPNETYMALFHGSINNVVLETKLANGENYILKDAEYGDFIFKNYDFGLFGDIHKRQFIDKDEKFSYSGSLIQQDFSEELDKGYVLWQLEENAINRFIKIENDYAFYDLKVHDKISECPLIENPAKYPRIKIELLNHEYTIAERKALELSTREKYNPIELHIINDVKKKDDTIVFEKIKSTLDLSVQEDLLRKYFKNYDKEKVDKIIEINKEIFNSISRQEIEDLGIGKYWEPQLFKFNNILSYGKDNEFDFTKYKGVNGIFAPNKSGKTNFLDALIWTLFNEVTKTNKYQNKIINNNERWCDGELTFKVDGVLYKIYRKMEKQRDSGTKTSLDLKVFMHDKWESRNEETRPLTDKAIRKLIGTIDDFTISSLSPQGKLSLFFDGEGTGEGYRLNLLSKFLGVNIYQLLHKIGNDRYKNTKTILDEFKKTDYSSLILSYKEIITETEKQLVNERDFKGNTESGIWQINNQIDEIKKKIVVIPVDLKEKKYEEEEAKRRVETIKEEKEDKISDNVWLVERYQSFDITTVSKELLEKKSKKQNDISNLEKLHTEFDLTKVPDNLLTKKKEKENLVYQLQIDLDKESLNYNEGRYNKHKVTVEKLSKLRTKFLGLNSNYAKKETEISGDLSKVETLKQQTWNDTDPLCQRCHFYQEASTLRSTVTKVNEELTKLKREIDNVQSDIHEREKASDEIKKLDKVKKSIDELTNKFNLAKKDCELVESEIAQSLKNRVNEKEKIAQRIETEKSNLKNIELEIEQYLKSLIEDKNKLKNTIDKNDLEIEKIELNLKLKEKEYEEIKKEKEQAIVEQNKQKAIKKSE